MASTGCIASGGSTSPRRECRLSVFVVWTSSFGSIEAPPVAVVICNILCSNPRPVPLVCSSAPKVEKITRALNNKLGLPPPSSPPPHPTPVRHTVDPQSRQASPRQRRRPERQLLFGPHLPCRTDYPRRPAEQGDGEECPGVLEQAVYVRPEVLRRWAESWGRVGARGVVGGDHVFMERRFEQLGVACAGTAVEGQGGACRWCRAIWAQR
jgi:hypothetical protein